MRKYPSLIFALLVLFLLSSLVLTACGGAQPTEQVSPTSAPVNPTVEQVSPVTLDGAALLQERCTICHNLDRVQSAKKTAAEWKSTVERMVGKGAKLNAAEQEAVISYLVQAYP